MAQPQPRPLVAIVNTSEEISELLRQVFEDEGFQAVVAYVTDFKRGEPDAGAFLTQHDPRVVVWDIAIPYEENWEFFQSVQRSEAGRGRWFVLTTTNRRVLEQLVGPTGAFELVGKPFDLYELVETVRKALSR